MADLNFVAFTFVFMIPTFYFLAVHRCTAGNPERGYAEMWELFPTKGTNAGSPVGSYPVEDSLRSVCLVAKAFQVIFCYWGASES